jgi:hypothetical protein
MITATAGGPLVPCDAPATVGIWSGDAIAAQRFTRRSLGRTADYATEARYRAPQFVQFIGGFTA